MDSMIRCAVSGARPNRKLHAPISTNRVAITESRLEPLFVTEVCDAPFITQIVTAAASIPLERNAVHHHKEQFHVRTDQRVAPRAGGGAHRQRQRAGALRHSART